MKKFVYPAKLLRSGAVVFLLVVTIFLSPFTSQAYAQAVQAPVSDSFTAKYGDPQFTLKLTKVATDPIASQPLVGIGKRGDRATITWTFDIPVDFSQISAIFAKDNSDYLEGKFQDQNHQDQNLLGATSKNLNDFFGPEQKITPKIITDDLKAKYLDYVSTHPNLTEYKNKISNIEGNNPKTVSELMQFGKPDIAAQNQNSESWSQTWGKYWAKIPTAYSQSYKGFFVFRVADGKKEKDKIENEGICPPNINNDGRIIGFVLPEYFRTASTADQINQILVPKGIQSYDNGDKDLNPALQTMENIINSITEFIQEFKDAAISKAFGKIFKQSFNFINPVSTVYAQEEAPPPDEGCNRAPIKAQSNGKTGTGPFYSFPEFDILAPAQAADPTGSKRPLQLETGESCDDPDHSPYKIDSGNFVKCHFKKSYTRTLTIGDDTWDKPCVVANPVDLDTLTCQITIYAYPVFYIPWLAPIWNNTIYSDKKNDQNAVFGSQQVDGRPGIFGLFTPKAAESAIFPQGKNLPSTEQESSVIKQRFMGSVCMAGQFARDFALLPLTLQQAQGISINNLCSDFGNAVTGTYPVTKDNCDGKYSLNNPLGNFGDTACDFSPEALAQHLKSLDPINWLNMYQIAFVEGGNGYAPNAYNPAPSNPNAGGAWGLFQMAATGKGNTQYDQGDVPWKIQASNAVSYNNSLPLNSKYCYWEAAGSKYLGLCKQF